MQIKKLIRNSIYNSVGYLISTILVLVVTPYFVFSLGKDGFGIFSLITGLIGYYNLLDFGLSRAITKFISEFKAAEDNVKISKYLNAALFVQFILGLIGSISLLLFDDEILHLIQVSDSYYVEAKASLRLLCISFPLQMLSSTFISAFQGFQNYKLSSSLTVLSEIIRNTGITIILFAGYGLYEVCQCIVGVTIFMLIANFICLRRLFLPWRLHKFGAHVFNDIFSFSLYLFISNLSRTLSDQGVKFVIAYFLGPIYVTYYTVPYKAIRAIRGLLTNAFNTIFPFSSEIGAKGDFTLLRNIWNDGSKLLISISAPIYLCIAVFSDLVMSIWMGDDFSQKTSFLLSFLSIITLIRSYTIVPINLTIGLGKSKMVSKYSVITLIFFIVFVPKLTSILGINGTLIALLICSIPGQILTVEVARKLMDFRYIKHIHHVFKLHYVPIIIALLSVYIDYQLFLSEHWIKLLTVAGLSAIYLIAIAKQIWIPKLKELRR